MSYQNILITGANRGLGLEFVKQYLALGPKNIIATTRSESDALNQLKATNSNLHILKFESVDYGKLDSFVESVKAIVGADGLDLLINNAGIFLHDSLSTLQPETIMKNIENNAVAPLMLTKHFLPVLRETAKSRRTVVVQLTSGLGSIAGNTTGGEYAYRASKAAMNMLSKSLANDVKGDNIIVILMHPGWVQTDLGSMAAPITPPTSVSGMVKVIAKASIEKTSQFVNYLGDDLPW